MDLALLAERQPLLKRPPEHRLRKPTKVELEDRGDCVNFLGSRKLEGDLVNLDLVEQVLNSRLAGADAVEARERGRRGDQYEGVLFDEKR